MGTNKGRVGLEMLWLCASVVTYKWDYQQQQKLKGVLGAFSKLLKATIKLHRVRPSVRKEKLCSYWTDSHEI
jgi:hypothetical protein